MTTFTRYYDNSIREWVETPAQHTLIEHILSMDLPTLDQYKDDLNTEVAIDPSFESTHQFRIIAKTVIRRYQALRHAGVTRQKVVGPAPSLFEMTEAAMMGVIIGDEFAKRIKGA